MITKIEKKTFDITVKRISVKEFDVEATNITEARKKVLENAMHHDWAEERDVVYLLDETANNWLKQCSSD